MPEHPHDDEFDPDAHLRRLVEADARVLRSAAARLHRLGWLWIFFFAAFFIFTLVMAGGGNLAALIVGSIVGVILIGISLFYFALASYVSKGHRWAIGIALFLVSVFVTLLLWHILTPRPTQLVIALMETMYLIGTLGLFKALLQSWGAARRLNQFAQRQPVEEYGMADERV